MQSEIYTTGLGQDLTAIIGSVKSFLPEICLCLFLFLLVIVDLLSLKRSRKLTAVVSVAGFIVLTGVVFAQWQLVANTGEHSVFLNFLLLDKLSVFLKVLFSLAGLLTVLLSFNYKRQGELPVRLGEYHTLIYGLILGAMLLVMSVNLLMIYLAIEIISISSYILTNFNFGKRSAEASLKFLLFGAVSSAIMLYGMSLLYGFTGTLDISSGIFQAGLAQVSIWPFYLAVAMVLAGFFFKMGVVPFHVWSPDVYEGAPTPVVALFSTVPKIAAAIALLRFVAAVRTPEVISSFDWNTVLSVVAIATMLIGNLSALWQKNAQRMLAYSSIAHAGFMLLGVIAYSRFGLDSLLFYGVVYLFMNFAAFALIKILKQSGHALIKDFAGWGKASPFIGVATIIIMISLTGIPPTAGFTAKLLLFSSVWEAYQTNHEPILLLLFGVGLFNTVLALFYYIKIPYYMFFRSASHKVPVTLQKNRDILPEKYLLGVLVFPLLILFFKSNWLTDLIHLVTFEF